MQMLQCRPEGALLCLFISTRRPRLSFDSICVRDCHRVWRFLFFMDYLTLPDRLSCGRKLGQHGVHLQRRDTGKLEPVNPQL